MSMEDKGGSDKPKGDPNSKSAKRKKEETSNENSSSASADTKKLIWTPEMRCTEVMIPKEVTHAQKKPSSEGSSGALVDELMTKGGEDATPSRSVTSFADNTWKPDSRPPDDMIMQPALKDAIRQIREKIQQRSTGKELPPLGISSSAVPRKQGTGGKLRPLHLQALYGIKDGKTSPLREPLKRVRSMDALRTLGARSLQPDTLVPTLTLDTIEEVQLGEPLTRDQSNSWKLAVTFGSGSSYRRLAGFHKTPCFRVRSNEYRHLDTRCVYRIEPVVMLTAEGNRMRATMVHANDLLEVTRCRFEKRCSDLAMNSWLRRIVLETVGLEDPEELFEDVEDETDLVKEFPRCNQEEAIKDGLRSLLFSFDLLVNFIEYLVNERIPNVLDNHRASLQEFIQLTVKNFLKDSTADSLATKALVRGNDDQVMSTLFGRLLEWTDLVGEKFNQIPEFLLVEEGALQRNVADSEKQGTVLADQFLPEALRVNSIFRKWCNSYSSADANEEQSVLKTPVWLADDIRNAYESNLVESDLKAMVPFLRFLHKSVQVETDLRDIPCPDWSKLMLTSSLGMKRKAVPQGSPSTGMSRTLLHTDQTQTATSASTSNIGSPQTDVTVGDVKDKKVVLAKIRRSSTTEREGADQQLLNASNEQQAQISQAKAKLLKLPPLRPSKVCPLETPFRPKRRQGQSDDNWKAQEPVSDPLLLKDLEFLEAHPPDDCVIGRRERCYPGEKGEKERPMDLLEWATDTMRRFNILQRTPVEQQAELRDRFLREQGARLKRSRDQWSIDMKNRDLGRTDGPLLKDYELIRRGVRDKVMFRKSTPVPIDDRSIRLGDVDDRKENEDHRAHVSFVKCFWSYLQSSQPKESQKSLSPKSVKSKDPMPDENLPLKTKQGQAKSLQPSKEEVGRFINEITYGMEAWRQIGQSMSSKGAQKGRTQQESKQVNK